MAKRLVREHPAMFLGELREDFERIYAEDENGNRINIKVKGTDDIVSETLIEYPNEEEFEIVEE